MVKQTNTAQFDLTSFLKNGALLQLASNQFKLIIGPFLPIEPSENELNFTDTVLYQPDFWDFLNQKSNSKAAFRGANSFIFDRDTLVQILKQFDLVRPLMVWKSIDSQPFKEQFDWSQRQFTEKKLHKTVPIISQDSQTRLSPENLAWVLTQLLSEDQYGWAYGFWQNGQGYLGQTPELIAEWNAIEKTLKTAALAGTVKTGDEQEKKIMTDTKIRQEHQFVVDDITENLKKVLLQSQIRQEPIKVLMLKHLLHLKTDFYCHDVTFQQTWQVILALHPTAALGIYPRDKNEMKIFLQMSLQNERRNFAAPFAMMNNDHLLCIAAIRNFYFTNQKVTIFTGCGVTSDSVFESELTELQIKRESVKRMMGLTE